jgi:hypothetical protein
MMSTRTVAHYYSSILQSCNTHTKRNARQVSVSFFVPSIGIVFLLTIRLLEASTSTASTVFFRFAPARIRNEEIAVILNQRLAELILGAFIDIFSIVGHNGLDMAARMA